MQRYFAKEKKENRFLLEPTDYHHIKNVMRMKENEEIEVVIDGILYRACVQNINEELSIRQLEEIKSLEKKEIEKVLCIPYLKEQKMDLILQKATELGVSKIYIVPLKRCMVKAKEEKEAKKLERWMRIVKEASEQSKRLTIPQIIPIKEMEALQNIKGLKIICLAQKECKSIKKVVKTNLGCDTINMVIGPEGGFSLEEEEAFLRMGFTPVSLGSRVLRTETVPLYLLSVIDYELME